MLSPIGTNFHSTLFKSGRAVKNLPMPLLLQDIQSPQRNEAPLQPVIWYEIKCFR